MAQKQQKQDLTFERKLIINDLVKTVWVSAVILGLLSLAWFKLK